MRPKPATVFTKSFGLKKSCAVFEMHMNTQSDLIIFSDFDGTIAQNDVGDAFFRAFSDWRACEVAIKRWERNEISSREVLELAAHSTRVTRERFEAFCAEQPLAPGFAEFAALCRKQNRPLVVLSDGLEAYIQSIFRRHALALPVFSNHLEFIAPDRVAVKFPYWKQSCGRCANCKRQHVRRFAQPGRFRVYIGDGFSDRCGAQEADLVFAKGALARWCEQEHKQFQPFEDFNGVQKFLEATNPLALQPS